MKPSALHFLRGLSSQASRRGTVSRSAVWSWRRRGKHIPQDVMKFWLYFTNLSMAAAVMNNSAGVVSLHRTYPKWCSYQTAPVYTHGRSWNICERDCLHSKQMNLSINSCLPSSTTARLRGECVHACKHRRLGLDSVACEAAGLDVRCA